jgi:Flp pilus assembly protein TadD
MSSRLLNVLTSYGIYLGQMVWPVNLAILYRHPTDVDVVTAAVGGVLIVVISAVAWMLRRRYPELIWGWLWYLITLLPVVGFFATGSEASADRFAYVPLIGPFAALALIGARFGRRMAVPAAVVLVLCSVLTFQQIAVWQNSLTLFRRAFEMNPNGYRTVSNMAYMLTYIREFPAAEMLYRRALELNPRSAPSWDALGGVLQQMGRVQEAIGCARKALAIDPKQIVTRCNLASALEATGDPAGAEAEWRRAIETDPKLAVAHFHLGKLLVKAGRTEEARQELTTAAQLDPANKEIQAALSALRDSPAR